MLGLARVDPSLQGGRCYLRNGLVGCSADDFADAPTPNDHAACMSITTASSRRAGSRLFHPTEHGGSAPKDTPAPSS